MTSPSSLVYRGNDLEKPHLLGYSVGQIKSFHNSNMGGVVTGGVAMHAFMSNCRYIVVQFLKIRFFIENYENFTICSSLNSTTAVDLDFWNFRS